MLGVLWLLGGSNIVSVEFGVVVCWAPVKMEFLCDQCIGCLVC